MLKNYTKNESILYTGRSKVYIRIVVIYLNQKKA